MANLSEFENTEEKKVRKVQVAVEFEIESTTDEEAREFAAQAVSGLFEKSEGNENFVEQHNKVVEQLKPTVDYKSIAVVE